MKKLLFTCYLMFLPFVASAENVTIDGFEYFLDSKLKTAAVRGTSLTDAEITIPGTVTYGIIEYTVNAIEGNAFFNRTNLVSVTIPDNMKSIGSGAFDNCTNLASIIIPDNVTSIGSSAFQGCSSLSSLTIGSGVTSIGYQAFSGCTNLVSIIIPDKVTSIDIQAFQGCSSLSSLTIGSGVESIGLCAFIGCYSLTTVTIPNSVISIDKSSFQSCRNLKSVTIGSSVTTIGDHAFFDCGELTNVYCLAEEAPDAGKSAFGSDDDIKEITLHVPAASVNVYGHKEPWSSFKSIEPLEGDIPDVPRCAKPTISYVDGKIKFSCETEGVSYVSKIEVSDAKNYEIEEIALSQTYKVSVYAKKKGFDDSETVKAEFKGSLICGDVNNDGIVNVADHVKLSDIIMNQNQ
jgi:hypothetical protein